MFYLIISYSVFSWSLNTVKEIRRAFPAPVFIGVGRDIQTDRSFPCAHSCYNPTSSAPSAFGLTRAGAWAHKPCLLGGLLSLLCPVLPQQVGWQGQAAFSRDQACAAHASVQITVWMCPGQLLQGTRLFCVASKRLQYKHKLLKAFCMGKWVSKVAGGGTFLFNVVSLRAWNRL